MSFSELTSRIAAYKCIALSPRQYVVGYECGAPQFLYGRQEFRCVSFISAYVKSFVNAAQNLSSNLRIWNSSQKDLSTLLTSSKVSGQKDLLAVVRGFETLPGSLSVSIVGSYCQTLSPKEYVVGYVNGVPQFITGRQKFRCVSFLSAYINQVYFEDLTASILGVPRESRNLGAIINAVLKQGVDGLRAIIRGWSRENYFNLSAFVRGMVFRDLSSVVRGFTYSDLGSLLNIIPGKDLSVYLKVWPMRSLPGNIHGWQESDLTASIDWNIKKDLPSYIGTHIWKNLSVRLKGWVREATKDLSSYIRAFLFEDLPVSIRSTYLEDLTVYIFSIIPRDLSIFIHGWDERFLSANIVGKYGPYDLRASINAYNRPKDLSVFIVGKRFIEATKNLNVILSSWNSKDLGGYMSIVQPSDLNVSLIVKGFSEDLPVFIYPKMIHLTTIISVSTMEHLDLSATINFVCRRSAFKNLESYIRCTHLSDLGAEIIGKKYPAYSTNLSATIGYADSYISVDKLPLSVGIYSGYSVEDKLPIHLRIYNQLAALSASIIGTPQYKSLSASLTPVYLSHYEFDNVKKIETVIHRDHGGSLDWYKVVELSFQSIVNEYFYVEGGNKVYRTDKTQRWRTDVKSYTPEDVKLNIRRKLFRARTLYDLSKFGSIDEAVRFAIDYVTRENYSNLSSFIASSGSFLNLPVSIKPKYFTTTDSNLSSTITADERMFVVGLSDDGIDVL